MKGFIIFFALCVLGSWGAIQTYLQIDRKAFYMNKYAVGFRDRVTIAPKPHDCNWTYAPIGDKACHYEEQVLKSPQPNDHTTEVYVGWRKVAE